MRGVYVIRCDCGWQTAQKKNGLQPTVCEACNKASEAVVESEVACLIMTIVREHAKKHGLIVYQISPRKWIVLEEECPCTVNYNDGQSRSYLKYKPVSEAGTWQQVMKIIRDKTPPLPAYLAKS